VDGLTAYVSNSTFHNISTAVSSLGNVMYIDETRNGLVVIDSCRFSKCSNKNGKGGALFVVGEENVKVMRTVFERNEGLNGHDIFINRTLCVSDANSSGIIDNDSCSASVYETRISCLDDYYRGIRLRICEREELENFLYSPSALSFSVFSLSNNVLCSELNPLEGGCTENCVKYAFVKKK
jgi:hypothetical protein